MIDLDFKLIGSMSVSEILGAFTDSQLVSIFAVKIDQKG